MANRTPTVAWATYNESGAQTWLSKTHIRRTLPGTGVIQRTLCGKEVPRDHLRMQDASSVGTTGRGTCQVCADVAEASRTAPILDD